ncbi:hypothetical protein AAMO2058_000852600 [Amorphochlora amoebiformis]
MSMAFSAVRQATSEAEGLPLLRPASPFGLNVRLGLSLLVSTLIFGAIMPSPQHLGLRFFGKQEAPVVFESTEPKPFKMGDLMAQSAGIAAGAIFLKRGVGHITRKIRERNEMKNAPEIIEEPEEKSPVLNFTRGHGNLFFHESMARQKDITSSMELLGSGMVDSTSGLCVSSSLSVHVKGQRVGLINDATTQSLSAKEKASAAKDVFLELLASPMTITLNVLRPISKKELLKKLTSYLTAWIPRGQRRNVRSMVNEIQKDLEKNLQNSKLPVGTTIRFNMLLEFTGKLSSEVPPDAGSPKEPARGPIVELMVGPNVVSVVEGTSLVNQLLLMIVGPKPISKSCKQGVLSSVIKVVPLQEGPDLEEKVEEEVESEAKPSEEQENKPEAKVETKD